MLELPEIPGVDREDDDFAGEPDTDAFAPEEEPVEATPEADESEDIDEAGDEAPEAESDEQPDYEALREKASNWEAWAERWARDPGSFMSAFFGAMTPEQQQAFLAAKGAVKAPEAEPEPEYEPQSDIETLYLKERKQYQADRKVLQDIPKFADTVNREFTVRDQFINDVSISNAILEYRVNALIELLDANLPDADLAAINKALIGGKATYKDAVAKSYKASLDKAVKTAKQAKKPRPNTPANQSNGTRDLSNIKDMTKLFKLMG